MPPTTKTIVERATSGPERPYAPIIDYRREQIIHADNTVGGPSGMFAAATRSIGSAISIEQLLIALSCGNAIHGGALYERHVFDEINDKSVAGGHSKRDAIQFSSYPIIVSLQLHEASFSACANARLRPKMNQRVRPVALWPASAGKAQNGEGTLQRASGAEAHALLQTFVDKISRLLPEISSRYIG